MRRTLLGLTGVVVGTTLLISLKSAPGAARMPAQVIADEAAAARRAAELLASASPSGAPPSAPAPSGPVPSAGAPPGPGSAPGSATAPGAQPSAAGAPPPVVPSPPRTTPAAPPPGNGPIAGDSAFTEFGYVTVGITVTGGRITEVIAMEMPADESRSVSISNRAAPQLRERALAAQGTRFDTVSGATWTSDAFKQSLRSAMDKAGLA